MTHLVCHRMLRSVFGGMTVLALCLNVTGPFAVQAETGTHTDKEVINVGFFAFDGYHMQDSDGTRSGYGYEFLQKLGMYTGWTYNYVGYDKSWSDMQDMLMDGTIDMVTSAQKTEERQKNFAFSDESIGTNSAVLTIKSGNQKYTAGDYQTYEGMRIGVLSSSSRNDKLVSFAKEKGFTYIPVTYQSAADMTRDLQNGTVDALFTSSLRIISNEWILDQFDSADFYVMVRKDNTALLKQINNALSELDSNYPNWRNELWNKYYQADTGSEIAFTAAERQYIETFQQAGTKLTAIVEPDRIPYSYFENGEAKGIMPEIFYKIEEATGLSFDIIETKDRQEYSSVLASDQHIDVQIDALSDYYQAEINNYKLTDSYISAAIDKVSGKANTGIAAILKTGDLTKARADLLNGDLSLLYCDSCDDCIKAVKEGRADYTYLYTYSAQHYVDADTTSSLKAVTLPQYSVCYSLGVAVDTDPRLLTILDKAVNHVQGSITQKIILEQTNSTTHSMTLIEYLQSNPILFVIVCVVVGLLIGLIILSLYRRRSMRLIAQKNQDLEAAINDTLSVSRIESGKTALYLQYAPTKEIYENLTLVISGAAAEKGVEFHTTSDVPEDIAVNIDKTKMQEIFMNLLSNAIKYTPKGGDVWYDVHYGEEKDGWAMFRFTVKDNGIGISKEFQKKMFDSFTQEHQDDKTVEGTGLGLYIVKRYVDLMHGQIEVESEPGKGTTFVVDLSSEIKHISETKQDTDKAYDFTGARILLTEDNSFNQEIAKTLLELKGAEVEIAENGEMAVERFRNSAEGNYTAVLMDIHMPLMNGFEATKSIRSMSRSDAKTVPIIAMTADAYDQDVKNCIDAGMNSHVAKPIDPENLYHELDTWI